jgi:hypothetical protein
MFEGPGRIVKEIRWREVRWFGRRSGARFRDTNFRGGSSVPVGAGLKSLCENLVVRAKNIPQGLKPACCPVTSVQFENPRKATAGSSTPYGRSE